MYELIMVKYYHCEKCKSVYNTEPWIGEVHVYNGTCSSCSEGEQQENQVKQESAENYIDNNQTNEFIEMVNNIPENSQLSPIEIEKNFISNIVQKANDVILGEGSINVLIKEIKDFTTENAKKRIEETFQSFDVNKIDAQKAIDNTENILDYLSEYKDYMDKVTLKIHSKPKMKVKTAIDKVFKDIMSEMPKDISKDVLLNKKSMLNNVTDKVMKCCSIYKDTGDVFDLTKKMVLHPFNEIQSELSDLPFYKESD
jgi:hypothetical protein